MLRKILQFECKYLLNNATKRPSSKVITNATYTYAMRKISGQVEKPKVITMEEVKSQILTNLGLAAVYDPVVKPRDHLTQYEPKLEDLPPRSMQDSFTTAILPFSTDLALRDKYIKHLGHVRFGRLMEDLDLFAVWVCHQHIKIPNLPEGIHLPYTFVTILVDKITFTEYQPSAQSDIKLSGHVSWVGRSSMEIVVWLEQEVDGVYKKITRALFLMAARNATNTGAAVVNPIVPATEDEKKILAGGEGRKKRRQQLRESSIFKVEPNDLEQTMMYDVYKRTTPSHTMELNLRVLPKNARWMSDTKCANTVLSFPENRNAHNSVFGGYIMRNAVELSWVTAVLYANKHAQIKHVTDISFEKPVSSKAFLKIYSYVVYTEENNIQVMTVVDVLEPLTGVHFTSNVLYSTFVTDSPVPEVLPSSYHESMWYIQGRRKYMFAKGLDAED